MGKKGLSITVKSSAEGQVVGGLNIQLAGKGRITAQGGKGGLLSIAVTPSGYDDIGKILNKMGYEYETIPDTVASSVAVTYCNPRFSTLRL